MMQLPLGFCELKEGGTSDEGGEGFGIGLLRLAFDSASMQSTRARATFPPEANQGICHIRQVPPHRHLQSPISDFVAFLLELPRHQGD
jgi:hypothetical protein